MNDGKQDKPQISYPCSWIYTVIGSSRDDMQRAVKEVFQERPCVVAHSKTSAAGNYCSLKVEADVYSDQDRTELFARLSAQGCIKIVV